MKQLGLPFAETPSYATADFLAAPSNEQARVWLAQTQFWAQGRLVLWGEPGCGKTHLLHIWAAAQQAEIRNGAALRHSTMPPNAAALAIDDADTVPDEEILLHLLNNAAAAGAKILLAARLPPSRQAIALPDLASRLRAAMAVEIKPPEDQLLASLLGALAADRQLCLSIPVRNFLLSRLPRRPAVLREAVARLDRAALSGGRKISRAFAAGLLAELADPDVPNSTVLPNSHSPDAEGLL